MGAGNERYSDGDVPSVYWGSGSHELNINRYNPDNRNDNLRAREKSRPRPPLY